MVVLAVLKAASVLLSFIIAILAFTNFVTIVADKFRNKDMGILFGLIIGICIVSVCIAFGIDVGAIDMYKLNYFQYLYIPISNIIVLGFSAKVVTQIYKNKEVMKF